MVIKSRWSVNACIAGFNLVLVVPSIYLWLGLPLVLRQHDWNGTEIGLFQLAGLPVVLKGLMAWPIDKGPIFAGRYKAWTLFLIVSLVLLLCLIAADATLLERPSRLFMLALFAGLLASWADVPLNALLIRSLPRQEQMRAGAWRSSATFLGAIVGGGLLLVAQTQWGWAAPFLLMATGLVCSLVVLSLASFPPAQLDKEKALIHSLEPRSTAPALSGSWWRGFYAQPGALRWSFLLLTWFPCIGAAWFYLKPMLLDYGFPAGQVAWSVGVGGGLIGALASLLGGGMSRRIGEFETLRCASLVSVASLFLMAFSTLINVSGYWLLIGAAAIACAMGLVSAVAFGAMMSYVRPQTYALDYGYQAGLFALGRLLIFALAGALLDQQGYTGLLLVLGLCMTAIAVLISAGRMNLESGLLAVRQH